MPELAGLVLIGVAAASVGVHASAADGLPRAVSLDLCADQYLMALADDDQIIALTHYSRMPHSYFADKAMNLPVHTGRVEELYALGPPLALRSGLGDPTLDAKLAELGTRVVSGGFPANIAESLADLRLFGEVLGQQARAGKLEAEVLARLDRLGAGEGDTASPRPTLLYLVPGGTTTGPETFVGQLIELAGARNQMAGKLTGWGSISMEALVMAPPAFVVHTFTEASSPTSEAWRMVNNVGVQKVLAAAHEINIPSRLLSCSAWMALDAAELIATEIADQIADQIADEIATEIADAGQVESR